MNAEACLGFMNTPTDSPDTVNECEVNVNNMNIVEYIHDMHEYSR